MVSLLRPTSTVALLVVVASNRPRKVQRPANIVCRPFWCRQPLVDEPNSWGKPVDEGVQQEAVNLAVN